MLFILYMFVVSPKGHHNMEYMLMSSLIKHTIYPPPTRSIQRGRGSEQSSDRRLGIVVA